MERLGFMGSNVATYPGMVQQSAEGCLKSADDATYAKKLQHTSEGCHEYRDMLHSFWKWCRVRNVATYPERLHHVAGCRLISRDVATYWRTLSRMAGSRLRALSRALSPDPRTP